MTFTFIEWITLAIVMATIFMMGYERITDPAKGRGFTLFKFLVFNFSCWPWQESDAHRQWRHWANKSGAADSDFFKDREPKYAMGWKACGTNFYRTFGLQFTKRNVRIDLIVGIAWISWAPFSVKPRK